MILKKHTEVGVRLLYVFMILHINIRNLIFASNKMRSLWSFCQSFIQSSRSTDVQVTAISNICLYNVHVVIVV